MNFDSLTYLLAPLHVNIVATKEAIEDYVMQSICDYLDVLMNRVRDKYRGDESEWDKAIEFFESYMDEEIKDLKERVRK